MCLCCVELWQYIDDIVPQLHTTAYMQTRLTHNRGGYSRDKLEREGVGRKGEEAEEKGVTLR